MEVLEIDLHRARLERWLTILGVHMIFTPTFGFLVLKE